MKRPRLYSDIAPGLPSILSMNPTAKELLNQLKQDHADSASLRNPSFDLKVEGDKMALDDGSESALLTSDLSTLNKLILTKIAQIKA